MNLRDLHYLITVADLRNFSQAAEQCCVSQPTLSNQIKKLEESLGVQLFERSNKRVMTTETGELIVAAARRTLQEIDTIKDIAQNAHDPLAGKFRLGAFPTLATYIFPSLIPLLQAALPRLQWILVEEKTASLLDKLKDGSLDAALLALPIDNDQLEASKLFDDEFYLATPSTHPLASKKQLEFNDITPYSLMLLEEGHCLRDQALEVCHINDLKEELDFRATGLETLRQMVKAGTGITLMPQIATRNKDPQVNYVAFKEPKPKRTIGLVWRKTSARQTAIEKIKVLIQKQFNRG